MMNKGRSLNVSRSGLKGVAVAALVSTLLWGAAGTAAGAVEVIADRPATTTAGPRILVAEPIHDFGEVWVTPALSHAFEVRNVGTDVLKILEVKPGCGCTKGGNFDREIAPGQVGRIPLTLKTRNMQGFSRSIRVKTNDPTNPSLKLVLKGQIKRYVTAEPPRIRFGNIAADDEVEQAVTLRLVSGQGPLELLNDGRFGSFTAALADGETPNVFKLRVTGVPPFKEGFNSGRIKVRTNVEQQPVLEIPVTARVPRTVAAGKCARRP